MLCYCLFFLLLLSSFRLALVLYWNMYFTMPDVSVPLVAVTGMLVAVEVPTLRLAGGAVLSIFIVFSVYVLDWLPALSIV